MPRRQTTLAKNQMQLAIALSSSLEESKTRELSKQAEELSASAIEDGTVPENIKEMQKCFLERLQPPSRPVPKKRSNKRRASPHVVPALLSRSSEERLRILTEKVALVLIQEDRLDWAPTTIPSEDNRINVLWEKSSSEPFEEDRSSYYIASIALFVPPSNLIAGTKLGNLAELPGQLRTPVTKQPAQNASSFSQPETETKLGSREWSHFHQFSPKHIDQDRDAQTEMVNDWERMLNNNTMSDITIRLKGGRKLPAHKLVLYVRCPALLNDLDDHNLLLWDTITYSEALAFLEFIYCGKLTGTRNLRPNANGVASLARKYNVTDLLKLILTFNSSEGHSSKGCAFINDLEWNPPNEHVVNRNLSQDEGESYVDNNPPSSDLHIEDDEMLKDFFGTYNPTLSSTCLAPTSPLQTPYLTGDHHTTGSPQEIVDCDQFSSTSSPEDETTTPSFENKSGLEVTSKSIGTTSLQCPSAAQNLRDNMSQNVLIDETLSKSLEASQRKSLTENVGEITSHSSNDVLVPDHIEISSDDEIVPNVITSISPYKYVAEQREVSDLSKLSFETIKLKDGTSNKTRGFPEPYCGLSSMISKRKLTDCDDPDEQNWTSKKVCINEPINICSSDDSFGSCHVVSPPRCTATPTTSEHRLDCTFILNNSFENENNVDSNERITSNKSLDSTLKANSSVLDISIYKPNKSLEDVYNADSSIEHFNEIEPHEEAHDQIRNFTIRDRFSTPVLPENKSSQVLNDSMDCVNEMQSDEPMSCFNQSSDSPIKDNESTPTVHADESRKLSIDQITMTKSLKNVEEVENCESMSTSNYSADATIIDHCFSTPKIPKDKTLMGGNVTIARKMLEDSFTFDVNDSYLLREAETERPASTKHLAEAETSFVPLRTPLEDVKTSSPVTPLPDFNAMSNQQFQTELLKYGLKRNMTKNRGIKMLKYIYGQMHPLVEVVTIKGKELFIPIGDKTPASASSMAPCSSVQSPESGNDESSSSDEDVAPVLEETIFDREEHFSQEVLGVSDLKTAVKTWIFNHPELYESILRYEPVWLESIHLELKDYLNKNIKLNQLMDVLDEEGITFRIMQGARNAGRRRASPKKKVSPTKKKASPKKQAKVKKKSA